MLFWCSGCYLGGLGNQGLKKVQQLLTYCLHIGGLGLHIGALGAPMGALGMAFASNWGPKDSKKIPRGWLWDLLKTAIFFSVFEVLGAWGLPVGIIWTHMDAIWTPMELIGGRMVLIVAIVGL